jgi:hypothetical protein
LQKPRDEEEQDELESEEDNRPLKDVVLKVIFISYLYFEDTYLLSSEKTEN